MSGTQVSRADVEGKRWKRFIVGHIRRIGCETGVKRGEKAEREEGRGSAAIFC